MGRDDPIDVLFLTDMSSLNYYYAFTKKEPMVDAIMVPAAGGWNPDSIREARRAVRQYYARSYKDLLRYEFILLDDWEPSCFTTPQLEWIARAVREQGIGALSQISVNWKREWAHLTLWDVLPDDVDAALAEVYYDNRGTFEMIINEDPTLPPVFTRYKDLLDLKQCRPGWGETCNYVPISILVPRQGARVYAWAKITAWEGWSNSRSGTSPYVIGWRYEDAYTWCVAGRYYALYGTWGPETGYGPDAYFSMILYSTGRPLPEDVVMVHRLKERFYEYAQTRGLIISLVEFVEKFGANTNPLMVKVIAMDDRWEEARRQYIRQDYDECWSSFDELLSDVSGFQEDAVRLKNQALLWVYVTEWCTITGTSLIAGFVLWTLMVKRRFYRMVDQTRLKPPPGDAGAEFPEYSQRSTTGVHRGIELGKAVS